MKSFLKLVSCLKRFPGIGPKQAERLAVHVLRAPVSDAEALAKALLDAKAQVRSCKTCQDYTEDEECRICGDPGRDRKMVCVVEQPADVSALERSGSYKGLYHVLHGRLSPQRGAGPDGIRVKELLGRLSKEGEIREVILATDPDTEGEATALYLLSTLAGLSLQVTRLAQGIPMGGHLDYMDEQTLSCALRGRRDFSGGEQ